jgi:hypothetical protein
LLTTSDTPLTDGVPGNVTELPIFSLGSSYTVCPANDPINCGSAALWELVPDLFGLGGQGTGDIVMAYNGAGTITSTINMSGVRVAGVEGYPFVDYGPADGATPPIIGQPPQFPTALSAISQFNLDTTYALTGTISGYDNDILLDEWISASGQPYNQLEVAIFLYYDFSNPLMFGGSSGTSYIGQFVQPAVVNGVLENILWHEYLSIPGGGTTGTVWFVPNPTSAIAANVPYGMAQGEISMNLLPFLNEAYSTCGTACSTYGPFYTNGNEMGTEFGENANPNFTMTWTKMQIQECVP